MSRRARCACACALAVLAASGCAKRGAGDGAGGAAGEAGAGQGGGAAGAAGAGGEAATCLPGTVCVLALPFHADGDTTGSESLLYDAYACAPSVDESGPEIIYDVLVPAAGTLSATVTDGPTVDVDPHILASLKDGICLARDDVTASAAVEPGHVYVVVDTYVTGGVAQVGPYTLDLTLAP